MDSGTDAGATEVKKTRCSGHCCRSFCIGSPERLKEMYERAKSANPQNEQDLEDIQVYEMVIYLGKFPTNPFDLNQFRERFKTIGMTVLFETEFIRKMWARAGSQDQKIVESYVWKGRRIDAFFWR